MALKIPPPNGQLLGYDAAIKAMPSAQCYGGVPGSRAKDDAVVPRWMVEGCRRLL
jgi:hypothetical protein